MISIQSKYVLRVGLLLMVAALVTGGTGCPGLFVRSGDIIVIPDENLERLVREELRLPFGFLTTDDLLDLIQLDARDSGITDIRGLNYATNLEFLDLSNVARAVGSVISDITPLKGLHRLRFLNLTNNQIFDLTPLGNLLLLENLLLPGNDIIDIGPLVTNARNGGLGAGDTVAVSPGPLGLGEDGSILESTSPAVVGQIFELLELEVNLIAITFL